MANIFEDLSASGDLIKARILYASAFACSFIFYGFMVTLSPIHMDFLSGRFVTAAVSIAALASTYLKPKLNLNYFFILLMVSYLGVYLYLLDLHDWSAFHRWSYFVVAAIFCSCAFTWNSYLITAAVSLILPLVAGFFSPLSPLELIHFHSANLTLFALIGISTRAVFKYKSEVLNLTKTMVQSSKMAALGEMAGGIAHEINTPLSVIAGYAEMLRSKLILMNSEKRLIDIIEKIESTTFRIADIILGLRQFSREGSSDDFQAIDIREVITQALKLCSEKFTIKCVTLISKIPEIPLFVNCQKNQIVHAVINLLNNAFDACHKVPGAKIQIVLSQMDAFVTIHVSDNGPGVPRELDLKIMQPFFTTKKIGGGTGLGLSVASGIALSHHGSLYLDRELSASSFIFKIPLLK